MPTPNMYDDGFPEYAYPEHPQDWTRLTVPGGWFVYTIYGTPQRVVPYRDPNWRCWVTTTTNCLYVGMTGNLAARLRQHRRSKAWWPNVQQIMVGLASSRAEALDWELRAIRRQLPVHNIVGNPGRC